MDTLTLRKNNKYIYLSKTPRFLLAFKGFFFFSILFIGVIGEPYGQKKKKNAP